ncbi:hypothetical protein PybrP1_003926 [[Pythium] brassicae (nom. inval.)]|nr:hypothetical protein PybrP1_003926 [[Pythium] brassicae (nom. inval.)]
MSTAVQGEGPAEVALGRRDYAEALHRVKNAVVDTRASQSLDPIRLPTKLRSRIERAQRRAAAAKDGVSIFSPSTEISHLQLREDAAQPLAAAAPGCTAPLARSERALSSVSRHQEQQQPPSVATAALLREKVHLPDVVLAHKMRDFEAKTSANSLLLDPLDNSLGRLSIDEKERVMLRMQAKIQRLTKDIDEHFVRIKDELDANVSGTRRTTGPVRWALPRRGSCTLWVADADGVCRLSLQGVFDAAANYQRAQAICLVELQKRCKLEQLRDEAIREVVDGDENVSAASDGRQRRMSGKLSLLLAQSNQLGHDGAEDDMRQELTPLVLIVAEGDSKRETSSRHSTLKTGKPGEAKTSQAKAKKNCKPLPRLLAHGSNQHDRENAVAQQGGGDTGAPSSRPPRDSKKSPTNRREDLSPTGGGGERTNRSSHGHPKADTSRLGGGDRGDDALAHHPHIAQVLQHMASGGVGSSRRATSLPGGVNTPVSDPDDARPKAAKEHWTERSKAYQVIAGRTTEALRKRSERVRWDSLNHFTQTADTPTLAISDALTKRLSATKDPNGSRGGTDRGSRNASELSVREDVAEKRKRVNQAYASVQEQIRARLHLEKKRQLTSSAKSSRSKTSGRVTEAGVGIDGGSGVAASTLASFPECADPHSGEMRSPHSIMPSVTLQAHRRASFLGASASAPALGGKLEQFDTLATGPHAAPSSGKPALAARSASQLALRLSMSAPGLPNAAGSGAVHGRSDGGRNSLVEKKLRASHMRQRRKEPLIGAPVQTDFNTIGHHSNARMEERRYSAQTWMWHHPTEPGANGPKPIFERSNEDDDEDDGGDTFGYGLEDGGEGNDNDDDDDDDVLENDRTDDNDTDDTSSVAYSFYALESARSSRSTASTVMHAGPRKKKAAKKRHGKLLHQASSSSLHHSHASGQTAGSMAMQSRLEEIWRALEFPFSHKLLMLEKYAELQDADVFQCSLASWEKVAEVVLIRERMKAALKDFEEHGDVKPPSRFTGSEWMFVRSLQIETPGEGVIQAMSSQELVNWVREERHCTRFCRLSAYAAVRVCGVCSVVRTGRSEITWTQSRASATSLRRSSRRQQATSSSSKAARTRHACKSSKERTATVV